MLKKRKMTEIINGQRYTPLKTLNTITISRKSHASTERASIIRIGRLGIKERVIHT